MKIPALLPLGAAFVLGSAFDGYAQNVFLHWPLVPGPSGYVGPHMPGGAGPTSGRQQPARSPMQWVPPGAQNRAPDRAEAAISPGEPDETGRIGPTNQVRRDSNGRLLPTYYPR
jgi:hypothetical protein